MHAIESTKQRTSHANEEYDDCGVVIPNNNTSWYPIDFQAFIDGIYPSESEAINTAASLNEQGTEELEDDVVMVNCNIAVGDNMTTFFKTSLQFASKQAWQLTEMLPSKEDLLNVGTKVADLAYSIMQQNEEQEHNAENTVAELVDDFEEVAGSAEIEHDVNLSNQSAKSKLALG